MYSKQIEIHRKVNSSSSDQEVIASSSTTTTNTQTSTIPATKEKRIFKSRLEYEKWKFEKKLASLDSQKKVNEDQNQIVHIPDILDSERASLDNPESENNSPKEKYQKKANEQQTSTVYQSEFSFVDEGFIVTKKQPKKDTPAKIIKADTESHRKVSLN